MLADASNPAFSKFAAITQLPAKGRGAAGPTTAHPAAATPSASQPVTPPGPPGAGGLQRAVTMPASSGRPVATISVGSHAGGGGDSPTASAGSSVGGGTSWAAVFAAPGTPALTPPPRPPGEPSSDQEWPSLAGGSGGSGAAPPAAAEPPRPAPATPAAAAAAPQPPSEGGPAPLTGSTMAAQLARANSAPVKPAVSRAAAGRKAAQATGAGRGRGTKTLVPPPPPLSSAPKEESSQVQLSAASARDAKAAAGMQLKRSPSQKAAASAHLAAAAAAAALQPMVSPDRMLEPRSSAHTSMDASPSHASLASLGHDANGTHVSPRAPGGAPSATPQFAAVRQRSSRPPPGFAAGPPPGFERPLGGGYAPPAVMPQGQGQAQPMQNGLDAAHPAQLPLPSGPSPMHAAGNGLTAPVTAEARNGTGRTQSRFSFARSPPVGGGASQLPQASTDFVLDKDIIAHMPNMLHPHACV